MEQLQIGALQSSTAARLTRAHREGSDSPIKEQRPTDLDLLASNNMLSFCLSLHSGRLWYALQYDAGLDLAHAKRYAPLHSDLRHPKILSVAYRGTNLCYFNATYSQWTRGAKCRSR